MLRTIQIVGVLLFVLVGCDQGNKTTIPIEAPNQPPGFTSFPSSVATTFVEYTYQVTTIDAEDDPITLTLIVSPDGMTLDSDGLIRWTPTFEQVGISTVQISASDSFDAVAQTFIIDVALGPPMLSFDMPNPSTFVVGSADLTITATGLPDGGTITFGTPSTGGTGGVFLLPEAAGVPTTSPATFSFSSPVGGGTVRVNVTYDPGNGQDPISTDFEIVVVFPEGTNVFRSNPNLIVPESGGGAVTDTIPVTGGPESISDLVVILNLPNTFAGDLQIFLTHVNSGTTVELTTGNGGGGFNFFAPVIFDDDGADGPVTGITAPGGNYIPESSDGTSLGDFNGLDADSDWILQVEDVLGIDVGRLLTWILVFEGDPVPEITTFGTSWNLTTNFSGDISTVTDGGSLLSSVPVVFAPTVITDIRVWVKIEAAANSDLVLTLTGPGGGPITLSMNNGTGENMGIIFSESSTNLISSFTETTGISSATPEISPEPFMSFIPASSLAPLLVGNPNGDWTLTVSDSGLTAGDAILIEWRIAFNGDISSF